MPTIADFQAANLDSKLVPNPERFELAGALYGLYYKFVEGHTAASAQQYVSKVPRFMRALNEAAFIANLPNLVTDFKAIDGP